MTGGDAQYHASDYQEGTLSSSAHQVLMFTITDWPLETHFTYLFIYLFLVSYRGYKA